MNTPILHFSLEFVANARTVLREPRGIAFRDFLVAEVVRHPLVQKIVSAYEKHDRQNKHA